MSNEKVVINASPFILLCKAGLVELLPKLFAGIVMPNSVAAEIGQGRDVASRSLEFESDWLNCEEVTPVGEVLAWNLGDGETEVLSLVFSDPQNSIALIDDRAARKSAATLGLKTLGTAGIMVLAKKKGLVVNVTAEIENLQSRGLYLSDDTAAAIRKQAGEIE